MIMHLGTDFKAAFIASSKYLAVMKRIDNGWDTDVVSQIAREFTMVLHLLQEEEFTGASEAVPTDSASRWRLIYSVICIFDRHIVALQARD
jgi:hypothetical protein